jgi:PPOX class probable F420-dependent enzyme
MASLADVQRLVELDSGLASVTTQRADGSMQATVVNAGVVDHPVTGARVAAFVARGGTRKIAHLRQRPAITVLWRAGWAWVSLEGQAELCGPDDALGGVDEARLTTLLRDVFTAAGGAHEDWAEYDRVMATERRVAVLVTPTRLYANP